MTATNEQDNIPAGFRKLNIGGPFVRHNGGLYGRWTGTHAQVAFRVGPDHVNPAGTAHGGMLATLCDMLIPCAANYQEKLQGRFLPTINLSIDYIGFALLGAWVVGQADILKRTSNLMFAQGLIRADDQVIMRLSGVYKFGTDTLRAPSDDPFGLLAQLPE